MRTALENSEIYRKCQIIRLICWEHASEYYKEEGARKVASELNKNSLIDSLIEENKWEELFSNEFWLSVLEMAINLNGFHQNEKFEKILRRLFELFPEETKTIIFP